MLYPVQNIAQLLGRVLFPAFSEIQDDLPRFRKAYIRSSAIIALVSFPLMGGVAALAEPFVMVWMGPKWLPVATLITILAPAGMLQALGTTTGQLFMATGRTDLMFRWGIIASSLTVLSFVAGLPWGIKGVALSYAVATALLTSPLFLIASHLIQLSLNELWKAIRPITFATILMAIEIFLIAYLMKEASPATVLAFCILIGTVTYTFLIRLLAPRLLSELKAIAATMLRMHGEGRA